MLTPHPRPSHTVSAQVRALNAPDDNLRLKEVCLEALCVVAAQRCNLDAVQTALAGLTTGFERFFETTSDLESATVSRSLHVHMLTLFYRMSGYSLSVRLPRARGVPAAVVVPPAAHQRRLSDTRAPLSFCSRARTSWSSRPRCRQRCTRCSRCSSTAACRTRSTSRPPTRSCS